MDKVEAQSLLAAELEIFRALTYAELVKKIGTDARNYERKASSEVVYQVQIQFYWDGREGEDVRVLGAIEDGGWRAFLPLADSFIMGPDGTFVGE